MENGVTAQGLNGITAKKVREFCRNSPFEGGRALKICPVGKFSEGASLQGQGDVIPPLKGVEGCTEEDRRAKSEALQIPPLKGARGMY
jgi:hypothetical protein